MHARGGRLAVSMHDFTITTKKVTACTVRARRAGA